ncbi:MAG: hypothetical protein WC003_14980 [Terrimicrobiaceae bacterium]
MESYRNAEGQPRQRVVVSLGDASVPEAEKHRIARVVENHLSVLCWFQPRHKKLGLSDCQTKKITKRRLFPLVFQSDRLLVWFRIGGAREAAPQNFFRR